MPIVFFSFNRRTPQTPVLTLPPKSCLAAKRYYCQHKEAIKQYKKKYMKEYYVKNKEKIQEYQKQYRESKKLNPPH